MEADMVSNKTSDVPTYGKSGLPIPPKRATTDVSITSSQCAMPPESNPAPDASRDKRHSMLAMTQEQVQPNPPRGPRRRLRETMREDKPSGGSWSRIGEWMAGNPPPRSSSPAGRGGGSSRTSDLGQLAKELNRIPRDELITIYLDLFDRVNQEKDKLGKMAEELERVQAENVSLKEKIDGQNTDIRKAQETVFATLASTRPKAEDDDVIRGNIRAATKQWKPFAKQWALKHLDDAPDKDKVKELMKKHCAETEFAAHDGLLAKNNRMKAPYILLNTELAEFVRWAIIEQPFLATFGLGAQRENRADDPFGVSRVLWTIHDLIWKDDEAAAHLWRAQTVAAIDPPTHSMAPIDLTRAQEAAKRKEKCYRYLITEFESSHARFLFREISEAKLIERRTQLLEIFRAAGQVFTTLWLQRECLDTRGNSVYLKTPFRIDSPEVEPHASHKLDIEDGDTSMNDKPIQLVVEPAIVAWGNNQGEDYNHYKIWSRAVVWLSTGDSKVPTEQA